MVSSYYFAYADEPASGGGGSAPPPGPLETILMTTMKFAGIGAIIGAAGSIGMSGGAGTLYVLKAAALLAVPGAVYGIYKSQGEFKKLAKEREKNIEMKVKVSKDGLLVA